MRKRAQRRTEPTDSVREQKTSAIEKKPRFQVKKKYWISITLVILFFMVLFLNSYFNIISGVQINPDGEGLTDTYYLSGPDPYYNMRLVETTLETGEYPYYAEDDPLLNYPLGRSGGRPPLLNMFAIGFSRLLLPFMNEVDAIGYSMQFVPALFGALIVFPVYFIGKTLFGKKEGLAAAFLVAIIPIHIGSGHGSAYGLFDHDSFNLLLFFLSFFFLIKSITDKDSKKSVLYALLSGTAVAALTLTWVQARYLYTVIALYAIAQMLIDIFTSKINIAFIRNMVIILFSGYLFAFPVIVERTGFQPDLSLFLGLGVAVFGLFCILLKKREVPWVISLPFIFVIGGGAAALLYFVKDLSVTYTFLSPLNKISEILYGAGIYGNKVSLTIAEAGTYNISRSVMSYGPAVYWLAWAGLVLAIIHYYRQKGRRDYSFVIALFLINLWLATTAGRFLNDMVPLIAILAGWVTWYVISRVNYRQMIRNIRNAGGGLRGIRKGIRVYHILGIFLVAFVIIMPNAFLSLDAAVPSAVTQNGTSNMKIDYFGEEHEGAFGSSSYKEQYWVGAFDWLSQQDTSIIEPTDRPAFISWWDYGFYEAAVGDHPTVADNFQDGIPPASNFHTAIGEKMGIAIWIIRLLEGNIEDNQGSLTPQVVDVLKGHLGENVSSDVVRWMENPTESPSYQKPIGEEYDEALSQTFLVGEQYPQNAYYQDIAAVLNDTLDDEEITWLYRDIQDTTGYSIRYYGVEGYDVSIFNIFAFLADKSIVLHALRSSGGVQFYNAEDDFITVKYVGYMVNPDGSKGTEGEWTGGEINEMSASDKKRLVITDTTTERKPAYFDTMFYKTYVGAIPEGLEEQIAQLPCWEMRHFHPEYISDLPYFGSGRSAVVVAKYYEGAQINGTINFPGDTIPVQAVVLKNASFFTEPFPIDHDKVNTSNGSFSLIAPGGEIGVEIRRNAELGVNAFVMKTIWFNSTTDPLFAPITDAEAMRLNKNAYSRMVNITIDPASIQGYVYLNRDNKTRYNESVDEALANVNISMYEILEFQEEGASIGETLNLVTNQNGYYNASGLSPGIYLVQAEQGEFTVFEDYLFLTERTNWNNISKPELGGVEGVVFFDENENDEYDTGEEVADAVVDLLYKKINVQGTVENVVLVESITTDNTGSFAFSSLIPDDNYVLNATTFDIDTEYPAFSVEQPLTIEENTTITVNLSLGYAPVTLSGVTAHEGVNIGGISINLDPDASVENNTAQRRMEGSKEDGTYSIGLTPGSYNVSVDGRGNDNVIYSFEDTLVLEIGQGVKTYNIDLTRLSVNVSGRTQYNAVNIPNLTIYFRAENPADSATTQSDENGFYWAQVKPGTYNITLAEEVVTTDGKNYTYSHEATFIVEEEPLTQTYNIVMTREEI
jgi:asparagine N-glycosylation enzyme membrane subunit Stt3